MILSSLSLLGSTPDVSTSIVTTFFVLLSVLLSFVFEFTARCAMDAQHYFVDGIGWVTGFFYVNDNSDSDTDAAAANAAAAR